MRFFENGVLKTAEVLVIQEPKAYMRSVVGVSTTELKALKNENIIEMQK